MPQRKKNQNKENGKIIKRTTLQQINYTQQLRLPTNAANEYLQIGRSIELKKSNSKKPASRKVRCISAKQYGAQKPLRFKNLLKQFNSLKLINQKSKSPRSHSKSRPKTKKSSKKITQLNSRTNSSVNLTEKLERTINKLQHNYFRDQDDSQIPFVSTSEAFTAQQQKRLELLQNQVQQEINIKQMRFFSNQNEPSFKKSIQMLKGNIYQLMARRIQRAWRRYRTHKLICRYAKMIVGFDVSERSDHSQTSQLSDRSDVIIQTQPLYPQQIIQRKVTHVSDLQKEEQVEIEKPQHKHISSKKQNEGEQDTQQQVKNMKRQELKKLNQVINLLAANKKINDPAEKQKLLSQLMDQLQNDKKKLQFSQRQQEIQQRQPQYLSSSSPDESRSSPQKYGNSIENQRLLQNNKQYKGLKNVPPLNVVSKHKPNPSSHSSDSLKQNQEEFNSKKYIEYLDSDMYPISNLENKQQENFSPKICKKKQNQLLSKLGGQSLKRHNKNMMKVGIDQHFFQLQGQIRSRLSYRSSSQLSHQNSVLESEQLSRRQRGNPRNRQIELRKSSSQKLLKLVSSKSIKDETNQFQPLPIKEYQQQQIHQQSIKPAEIQEKIQSPEIQNQQIPRQNLQDLIKKQIQEFDFEFSDNNNKELKNLQEFDRLYSQEQLTKQLAQLKKLRDNDSDDQIEDRARKMQEQDSAEPVLQRTNNQPFQLHRINIQDYDHNIQSDQEIGSVPDLAEKAEKISQMAFHSLLLEVLKQMAKYPNTIIKNFKTQCVRKPSNVARAPSRNRKNGFVTNQAQVRNFVQQICAYLINDQPQILRNLEKSTGPSALQMLRYMHQTEDDELVLDDQQDDPSVMVLPNWVFDNYWVKKSQTLSYERQNLIDEREQQRHEGLKSLNKIFFRSLFDCLNQCLDYERNYGPFGRPFPWKKTAAFQHQKKIEDTKKSIERTQKRLLEVSSTYCGIIIQREQMLSICGNEEYLSQVQEDRLSRMLAQDLVEGEDRWIFYDDQQTQLLVQASNFLYNQLIAEAIQELFMLKMLSQ